MLSWRQELLKLVWRLGVPVHVAIFMFMSFSKILEWGHVLIIQLTRVVHDGSHLSVQIELRQYVWNNFAELLVSPTLRSGRYRWDLGCSTSP